MKANVSFKVICLASAMFAGCNNTELKKTTPASVYGDRANHLSENRLMSYDSLYNSMECEDEGAEDKASAIIKRTDSLLSSLIIQLRDCQKDTVLINPLLVLLERGQQSYKAEAETAAELIYWSYGTASMTGERVVAKKCCYLKELEKKLSFYMAINEKIHGTIIMN
ncbi:MAG: hypothetical protein QM731_04510 [Chitinophagaceae bacterium]